MTIPTWLVAMLLLASFGGMCALALAIWALIDLTNFLPW